MFILCVPQAKGRPRRKVEWPDGQESMRRSTDCERGRGNDYGHLRIERKLSETQMDDEDEEEDEEAKTNSMEASAAEAVPHPGPLSDLSVALVGFQRDHEVRVLQSRACLWVGTSCVES